MELLIYFCWGVFVGGFVTLTYCRFKKCIGTLRIDRSNPTKDVYRFDVGDLDKIAKKKWGVLRIDNNADLSQKSQTLL